MAKTATPLVDIDVDDDVVTDEAEVVAEPAVEEAAPAVEATPQSSGPHLVGGKVCMCGVCVCVCVCGCVCVCVCVLGVGVWRAYRACRNSLGSAGDHRCWPRPLYVVLRVNTQSTLLQSQGWEKMAVC